MRKLDASAAEAAPLPADDPLARLLELESEVRTVRALLETRNESFRALLARLVETERLAHQQSSALRTLRHCEERLREVETERDSAVKIATALQNLRLFRYSRAPRAAWGFVLRSLRLR